MKRPDYATALGDEAYQSDWIVADFSQSPLDDFYRRIVRDSLDQTGRRSED
ncbi:hypothetical protein [Sinomonas sp. ASV322]|uniref:hypothetical protein n=1 Tax=Sinomonas sp. ASV322 TaxID=3041920 RepID=UPI0027DB7465|nr:hypothetical protein [Sinomonas sp. ASV322]MDQ4502936.1 hypothetical protein [Sinomonas sp. ASV322]